MFFVTLRFSAESCFNLNASGQTTNSLVFPLRFTHEPVVCTDLKVSLSGVIFVSGWYVTKTWLRLRSDKSQAPGNAYFVCLCRGDNCVF